MLFYALVVFVVKIVKQSKQEEREQEFFKLANRSLFGKDCIKRSDVIRFYRGLCATFLHLKMRRMQL